jgi:hypothetical protein
MDQGTSLLRSQRAATGPCTDTHGYSPNLQLSFSKTRFVIIFPI